MRVRKRRANEKRYAFITGASSGIGLAVARLFVEKGWVVGLAARDLSRLAQTREELGEQRCFVYQMDVSDAESVREALRQFSAQSDGKLHALINSAGVLEAGRFQDVDLETHHKVIDTNLKGILNCTHTAFPLLKETPKAAVVNIGSASAFYGAPDFASYSASKFAVRALTEALNVEWADFDIHVSDVMPPFVDTPMLDSAVRSKLKAITWLGVNLNAGDVADSVWKNVNSRQVHTVVGLPFKFMAVGQKYSPHWLQKRVVKFVSGY
ncbi:MAG TPA: SDR family oxidoreductase [Pseudomonadales bacterium]|nr:SDR family oxidoreductase [Pseudomonadales bacterium]